MDDGIAAIVHADRVGTYTVMLGESGSKCRTPVVVPVCMLQCIDGGGDALGRRTKRVFVRRQFKDVVQAILALDILWRGTRRVRRKVVQVSWYVDHGV